MNFEFGKTYIVDVTEKGIVPLIEFNEDRWFDKDHDDLDFLTDEEKVVVINDVLDKIRAEIEQKIIKRPYMDFKDRERWHNDAILEVLDIIDKYRKGGVEW